jgi:AAA+ superfamily predicted ATPase
LITTKKTDPSLEYVKYELDLLELYLFHLYQHFKKLKADDNFELSGLVISDNEMDTIFNTIEDDYKKNRYYSESNFSNLDNSLVEQIMKFQNIIDEKKKKNIEENKYLSLEDLRAKFQLTEFEMKVLIICLAPEIATRFEKIYGYLQDDVTKKKPTIDLCLKILCNEFDDRIYKREYFIKSDLFKFGILEFADDQQNIISRSIKINDDIINFILRIDYLESLLKKNIKIIDVNKIQQIENPIDSSNLRKSSWLFFLQKKNLANLFKENVTITLFDYETDRLVAEFDFNIEQIKNSIKNSIKYISYNTLNYGNNIKISFNELYKSCIIESYENKNNNNENKRNRIEIYINEIQKLSDFLESCIGEMKKTELKETIFINLTGNDILGKKYIYEFLSMEILRKIKRSFLNVDFNGFQDPRWLKEIAITICREKILKNVIVVLDNLDSLLSHEDNKSIVESNSIILDKILELQKFNDIILVNSKRNIFGPEKKYNVITIDLPEITLYERKILWIHLLQKYKLAILSEEEIEKLASKFDFNLEQIENSIKNVSHQLIPYKDPDNNTLLDQLYSSCYKESNQNLNKFATKLVKKFDLDDIVLPESKKRLINDIITYADPRNREIVFREWKFEEKINRNNGVNILFTGPPGTGKTMCAQIIANKLEMEIYKIDLSAIVSKFIGETEQNINKIFEEAKTSNAIIFLDECDTILGKRTEITRSTDRYSNIEIGYLLQKLEEHDEIVILATNLKRNMDEAFIRRIQFIVDIETPNANDRLRIWSNFFSYYPYNQSIYSGDTIKEEDLEFFAKAFDISGATISNIALSAAFMAANEGGRKIEIRDIALATQKELEKIGKPIIKSNFGKYSNYLY